MRFPLQLNFKKISISPQITVSDASGEVQFFVKQKAFKFKEAVSVFADPRQDQLLFKIGADRVIDFSAKYHIHDAAGTHLGALGRRGMRSLWKAHYEVEREGGSIMQIREANPWIKVIDGMIGEIPVIGLLSGYFFHPAYVMTRADTGATLMRMTKQPALFESRYIIERDAEPLSDDDERIAVLSLLMLTLLERARG